MRSSANWISRSRCWVSVLRGGGRARLGAARRAPAAAFQRRPAVAYLQDGRAGQLRVRHHPHRRPARRASRNRSRRRSCGRARSRSSSGTGITDEHVFELEQFRDGKRLQALIGDAAFEQVRAELIAHDVPERDHRADETLGGDDQGRPCEAARRRADARPAAAGGGPRSRSAESSRSNGWRSRSRRSTRCRWNRRWRC